MANEEQSKFAHFEGVFESSVYDLYTRHAEVAREIHQDTLRKFSGDNSLTVDLVRESPVTTDNTDTLSKLAEYDVVSVSSGVGVGAIIGSKGVANKDLAREYKRQFTEEDMPIYVVAAGNEGIVNGRISMPRVADLARNSLVVGEANLQGEKPFVEKHSSATNPTLTSDSPFNRGEQYQYFNVSPSLDGHEDLIADWVIQNEINEGFKLFKDFNTQNRELSDENLDEAYWKIYDSLTQKYTESDNGKQWVQDQVQKYTNSPELLHQKIMGEFREIRDIDENGYATGFNGTSFSGPELAGYVSGAMNEQNQREEKNLPVLTKDEITTLSKLATIDTTAREGTDEPMHSYTNKDGNDIVGGGGHGVFNPEMFRALLEETYKRIETNPNIDRASVTATFSTTISPNQRGDQDMVMRSNLTDGQSMIIDRMLIDAEYNVNGGIPHYISLERPDQPSETLELQMANKNIEFLSWSRAEHALGESLKSGQDWKLELRNGHDATMHDAHVTVYGYNEGGLMDQMLDYSKELAQKLSPVPSALSIEQDINTSIQAADPPSARVKVGM